MANKALHLGTRCHVPNPRCLVIRPGQHGLPIRVEGNAIYTVIMAIEAFHFNTRFHVP